MKYKLLSICVVLLFAKACVQKSITIVPLKMLSKFDTTVSNDKLIVRKFDCYLIQGYKNDKASANYVDEFVKHNKANPSRYFEYHIFFYKESEITNISKIRQSIKNKGYNIDNEEDFVFDYYWGDYGKLFKRDKLDSGKVPPPSNIKIKNIPGPKDSVK